MYEDDFSTLFTKDDWRPISFHMEPNGVQRKRIKDLVEANSGYLFDTFPRDESNHLIRLANFDSIIINKNEDFFDVKYVECCVEAGKLLPNLIDYRINKRTSYAEYNPFDVMVGRIRWDQVPKKAQGEKVEFDDFSENIERNKRYLEFYELSTKKAYTRKEDIAILKYIQDYQVYSQVDGNLIWKKMQLKKVCNRSYQSMKERFRKQILPQINSYGLSQKQIKCFQEKREIYTPLRNMETSDSDGSLTPPPTAEQHRSRLRKKSREKNDPPSRGSRDNILRGAAPETENSCSSSPSRRTRRPEHGNSQSSPRHYPPKGPEKPDSREQQLQNNGNRDQLLKEAIFGSSVLNSQADNAELNDTDQEPFRVIQPSMSDANSESEEEVIKEKSSQEDENTKQQRTDQYKKDKPDKHKNSTKGKERTKSTEDNSAKNSANEDSARNAADESELRDAGVQRILFQDINIDSGAKAGTVNKRTFSTDSEKSPRKKRKLYCPERSHLSENVLGHIGVFQIPSPVLTSGGLQKKKASGSSRKELQDVASSSQEFAAGLRAASDVSQTSNDLEEPGLELTTTSLGGITSTQNIIEDSETPQTKKAPLPSVDENSFEEVTNKNDADLRTRSSTTRFANKNLLAKTSRKEGQNALQQVGEAYEDEGGSQELHLYLQPSQDQENKNDEEDKNESINLLQASDDKAIENSPPQESPDNYRILTNDRSLMVPMESDIFASDSDFESTKGQESHKEPENENNVVKVPNIDLDSSELQDLQVVDDPCIPEVPGVSPDIPNEVELANENEEIDHTEQRKNIDLDSSELQDKHVLDDPCPKDGGSPDVPGEIIPDINTVNGEQDYQIPVDHVEGAFDHLQAGNDLHNIVTDNVFEDHVDDPMDHPIDDPIDDQEVESEKDTDGEELQGVFSGQQLEQEEEIAIAGEERVDDSEEETRIRNKTTFQKRPLTKPAGKSRSGKKRRDLLVIKVPHDVGSSDIEIVRPGRHRKDSTSSQENSSQEVQRPRPKSRLSLSDKKKRKRAERQEKLRKSLEVETETSTDDVAAMINTDAVMNVAEDENNAENTHDEHIDSVIEITDDKDDNSQHASRKDALSNVTGPIQPNKRLTVDLVNCIDNTNLNSKTDFNNKGKTSLINQAASENDSDFGRQRAKSGGSTFSAIQRRNETSPDSRHRRRTGDTMAGAKTPVSGQRRQRFISSEEAHFAMVTRSPPVACCSGINTVTGKIQRRRRSSAAANTAAGPSAASAAAGPSTATTAAGPSAACPSTVATAAGPSTAKATGSNVSTSENSISSSETTSEKIEERKTITIRRKEDPGDMFRKPYTQEEERKLLAYFDTHGGYSRRKGKALWEDLERKRVLPGRSWQSMKSWFLKLIKHSSRLDTYGTSVAQLIDADKEIYRIDTDGEEEEGNDTTRGGGEVDVSRAVDQSIGGSKKKTIPYTVEEDKKILKFIIENKRYAETSGIALWKLMESGKVVGNRSYHSMKERFRKIIIKNIDNSKYGLTHEELDNFSSSDRRKNATQKRHKK